MDDGKGKDTRGSQKDDWEFDGTHWVNKRTGEKWAAGDKGKKRILNPKS